MVASEADPAQPAAIGDTEPDFRFAMANERTFLAWQRTALGLLAAAVAVVQFVPLAMVPGARHVAAALLAGLAILTSFNGIRRWEQVDAAMRGRRPVPRQQLPAWLAVGLVLVAGLGILLVLDGPGPR